MNTNVRVKVAMDLHQGLGLEDRSFPKLDSEIEEPTDPRVHQ